MRRGLLGAIVVVAALGVPSTALAQDDPTATQDPALPTIEQVTDDPTGQDTLAQDDALAQQDATAPSITTPVPAPVSPETATEDELPDQAAPPALGRFSESPGAPRWQQRDEWRGRDIYWRRGDGWYRRHHGHWFRWRERGQWERCDSPRDWSPAVVRPVPVVDPAPIVVRPDNDDRGQDDRNGRPNNGPGQQQNRPDRRALIRRAVLQCRVRYVIIARRLNRLVRVGAISPRQYRRAIFRARVARRGCIARAFSFRS